MLGIGAGETCVEDFVEVCSKGVPLLVNRRGAVRSVDRETPYLHKNGHLLMMKFRGRELCRCKNKMGYIEVATVFKNRKVTKHLVHRLVAMAFVPGYHEGRVVNHKNGDKTDNRPENLEWSTPGDNTKHAWETGLIDLRGENQPSAQLTAKRVSYIRKLLKAGISANTLAIVADVSPSLIVLIRDGERWTDVQAAE
jgi:hypothetical protein